MQFDVEVTTIVTVEVGGAGCFIGAPLGAAVGTVGGFVYGFFAGGYGWPGANSDAIEGFPNMDVSF